MCIFKLSFSSQKHPACDTPSEMHLRCKLLHRSKDKLILIKNNKIPKEALVEVAQEKQTLKLRLLKILRMMKKELSFVIHSVLLTDAGPALKGRIPCGFFRPITHFLPRI